MAGPHSRPYYGKPMVNSPEKLGRLFLGEVGIGGGVGTLRFPWPMCLFSCRFLFTTTACQSWAVASFGQKRKVTWFGALWLGRSLARREESPQWAIYVQTLPGILGMKLVFDTDTNHLATYLKNSEGAFVQANEPKSQVCPSILETGPRHNNKGREIPKAAAESPNSSRSSSISSRADYARSSPESNSPGADHWPPQGPQSQSSADHGWTTWGTLQAMDQRPCIILPEVRGIKKCICAPYGLWPSER